jgi:NADH:ubiquinone oxidoreductase subunit H
MHAERSRPEVVMHLSLLALEVGWGTTLAIKTLVVLMVIPLGALILGYVFLLKMMSHMQSRLGPMDPGGFHGWFQLVGDGIKFLQKEDIMPEEADRRVFALAPAIVVISKGATGPFRVKIRSASFSNVSILPWMLRGVFVPDVITILGSLYFILGDIDR